MFFHGTYDMVYLVSVFTEEALPENFDRFKFLYTSIFGGVETTFLLDQQQLVSFVRTCDEDNVRDCPPDSPLV